MGNKIIVCGYNGAGKSTLGKQLAHELGCKFMDIEDYFFPKSNSDYAYEDPRTEEEAVALLLADLEKYDDLVLACVKADRDDRIRSMLTHAVYLTVPKSIRIKRIRERSYQQFGGRMLPGGNLYEKEQRFFDLVQQRPENAIEKWLESAGLPVIYLDGTRPVSENTAIIRSELKRR